MRSHLPHVPECPNARLSNNMTTLKDLTWDAHKQAEQTVIMRSLLQDQIPTCAYCDLVYTKYQIYSVVESRITFQTPCLYRAQAALNDWQALSCSLPPYMPKFEQYVDHLRVIPEHSLWAHVYVHYLAPLYGGQIIRKRIEHRLPTHMMQFDDAQSAIQEVRSHVTVHMAPEANLAFEATTAYYEHLAQIHGIT